MSRNVREGARGPRHRVDVRRRAVGIDAVALRLPGDQLLERRTGGGGDVLIRERAHHRDPDDTGVELEGVGTGHEQPGGVLAGRDLAGRVGSRVTTLVDTATRIDQEVVADVGPTLGDRVVAHDRAHRRRRVRVIVRSCGVVNDDLLDGLENLGPGLETLVVESERFVRAPGGPRDDRGLGRCRGYHVGGIRQRNGFVAAFHRHDGQVGQEPVRGQADEPRPLRHHHSTVGLRAAGLITHFIGIDRLNLAEGRAVGTEGNGHDGVGRACPVNCDVAGRNREGHDLLAVEDHAHIPAGHGDRVSPGLRMERNEGRGNDAEGCADQGREPEGNSASEAVGAVAHRPYGSMDRRIASCWMVGGRR